MERWGESGADGSGEVGGRGRVELTAVERWGVGGEWS